MCRMDRFQKGEKHQSKMDNKRRQSARKIKITSNLILCKGGSKIVGTNPLFGIQRAIIWHSLKDPDQ